MMKSEMKRILKSLPLLTKISIPLLIGGYVGATPIVVPESPTIAARNYILMDYHSGKILAGKGVHKRVPPASLTKMMTSYIIGQEIAHQNISPDDEVVVSHNAWGKNFPDSSKMFIEVGDKVKVSDLNRGIIIQSGNDACVAMAEYISGSESAFVDVMNAMTKIIGMKDTYFTNVHGLPSEGLYSTPYDMAILGKALIRDLPDEYAIYSEKKFSYNGISQYNRNSLLWDKSINVDGIKTGHHSQAGFNLVSSAVRNDMRLIAVVMGTKSNKARKIESKKLLSYGFRFYETISPHKASEEFVSHDIWMGDKEMISLGLNEDAYVTLVRGKAKDLQADFVIDKIIKAPIKKGDVVGLVHYSIADEEIAEYPLVALESVDEGGVFSRFIDYIILLLKKWISF